MNKICPICGRAHFYTLFGVVRYMLFCTAPKSLSRTESGLQAIDIVVAGVGRKHDVGSLRHGHRRCGGLVIRQCGRAEAQRDQQRCREQAQEVFHGTVRSHGSRLPRL